MKRLTQLVAMGFNEMRLLCGNATDRLVLYGPLLDSLAAPDQTGGEAEEALKMY